MKARQLRISVDVERCKGCELCVQACPHGILAMSQDLNERGYHPVAVVSASRCTGCRFCALMCPDVVLQISEE